MRRHLFTVLAICLCTSIPVSARLRVSAGFEDIQGMAQHAPLVFRGQVTEIELADKTDKGTRVKHGVAVLAVDRWYRGSSSNRFVNLHFVYVPPQGDDGHYCRDLEVGSHQIVFAKPGKDKVLELFDDCDGALSISSLFGSTTSDGLLSQLENDFTAGLNDSAADVRIASIQRLAGLRHLRSTEALHQTIASGSEEESKWAIFAALKAGDSSVLPLAVPLLLNLYHEEPRVHHEPNGFTYTESFPYPQPEASMALAIEELRAPEAVPSLKRLANEATDGLVKQCATQALMEIKRLSNKPY
jgi:hypothetical protein